MATFEDRPHTALLVVDMQNAATEETLRRDEVVANVGALVEKARAEHVPVIWTLHTDDHLPKGAKEWRIIPELTPADGEPQVEKDYADGFENSILESELARLGVGRLVVVGVQTDEGIRSTLHGALVRGYDALLVSDAHTTIDQTEWGGLPAEAMIVHTNLYWSNHRAPGRSAGTVDTKGVAFAV